MQRLKLLQLSFAQSVACYNVYVVSVLAHTAQYHPVSSAIRAVEAAGLAALTSSPMHALPRGCMGNLKAIGLPGEVIVLDSMAVAAKARLR